MNQKNAVVNITKSGHIIVGWLMKFGLLSTSPAEKKLSELRQSICARCVYAKPNQVLKIINGSMGQVSELQCTKCGCPCEEKSLVVDEQCPLEIPKW